MKILKLLLATLICTISIDAKSITVAAAANLKYAMDDLTTAFTQETGIDVKIITASSGKLAQQIMSGAPYDVFLSADIEYPDKLVKSGYTATASQVYAYGVLVLWSNSGADLSKGVSILTDPAIRKIAIANPKTAPYGIEAMKAIKYYKIDPASLSNKIVNGESVSQAGTYIVTQAVDIGFVAKSIVVSPEMKKIGNWVELDPKSYHLIDQAMVVLKSKDVENQNNAKRFLQFMTSAAARKILERYGYRLPTDTKAITK